jgi:hypothetical protein
VCKAQRCRAFAGSKRKFACEDRCRADRTLVADLARTGLRTRVRRSRLVTATGREVRTGAH